MTKEQKDLLLTDLSARLRYGVIINTPKGDGHLNSIDQTIFGTKYGINIDAIQRDYFNDTEVDIKPYLRPMSSLIEKELGECRATCKYRQTAQSVLDCATPQTIDYLISHQFDFRGLISMGLALEAKEGMYKFE